ncbi:hypothetical protein [Mesorhizobium sp. M1406]|uniref:hypothetical protein n=1 Tax=Mesorhizobium sp. M1406 TaxID=2957099 RepID=UPI00333998CD
MVNKLVCHTTVPLTFETPWLVEARLPARYRIVGRRSLGADQRAMIRDFDEPGVNDDVYPVIYEEESDPHMSLALVDAEGGAVRGWAIHPTAPLRHIALDLLVHPRQSSGNGLDTANVARNSAPPVRFSRTGQQHVHRSGHGAAHGLLALHRMKPRLSQLSPCLDQNEKSGMT